MEEYRGIRFNLEKRTYSNTIKESYFYRLSIKRKRYWLKTGCTNINCAIRCVEKKIDEILDKANGKITLKEYTRNMWIWGKCKYVLNENARRPNPLSHTYCDTNRNWLTTHIWKILGDKFLQDITARDIEDFRLYLLGLNKYSKNTVNKILNILHVLFREAERYEDIEKNVMLKIQPLYIEQKEKGILKKEMIVSLFSRESLKTAWLNQLDYFTSALIAFYTGMRLGEVQALKWSSIDFKTHTIEIKHSWDVKYGLKSTKNGKERKSGMNAFVEECLLNLKKIYLKHGNIGEYVFCRGMINVPLSRKTIVAKFYTALKSHGINEEERRKMNITFHSLRHSFVSHGLNLLPYSVVQENVGHSNDKTTRIYSHMTEDTIQKIIEFQNGFTA